MSYPNQGERGDSKKPKVGKFQKIIGGIFILLCAIGLLLRWWFVSPIPPPQLAPMTFLTIPEGVDVQKDEDLGKLVDRQEIRKLFAYSVGNDGIVKNVEDLGLELKDFRGSRSPLKNMEINLMVSSKGTTSGQLKIEPVLSASAKQESESRFMLRITGSMMRISPEYTLYVDPFRPLLPLSYIQEMYYAQNVSLEKIEVSQVEMKAGLSHKKAIDASTETVAAVRQQLSEMFRNAIFAQYTVPINSENAITITRYEVPAAADAIDITLGSQTHPLKVIKIEHEPPVLHFKCLGQTWVLGEQNRINLEKWATVYFRQYEQTTKTAVLQVIQFPDKFVQNSGVQLRFRESVSVNDIGAAQSTLNRSHENSPDFFVAIAKGAAEAQKLSMRHRSSKALKAHAADLERLVNLARPELKQLSERDEVRVRIAEASVENAYGRYNAALNIAGALPTPADFGAELARQALIVIADAQYGLGQWKNAQDRYVELLKLSPDDVFATYRKANCYLVLDEIDAAIECYGDAIAAANGVGALNAPILVAGIYNNRGNAFCERKDFENALADYSEAMTQLRNAQDEEFGPYILAIRINRGFALREERKLEEAIIELESAEKLLDNEVKRSGVAYQEQQVRILDLRGHARLAKGETEKGNADLARSKEILETAIKGGRTDLKDLYESVLRGKSIDQNGFSGIKGGIHGKNCYICHAKD